MSNDNVTLSSFPSTSNEALALLYVEKHMKDSMSPSELHDFYKKTLEEIRERNKETRGKNFSF